MTTAPSPCPPVSTSEASTLQLKPVPTPPSIPSLTLDAASANKKSGQGSGLTTREDEAVAKAWIRISADAIVGSDKKGDVFYKAIAEYYAKIQPAACPKRNEKSVERRARKILTEYLAFAGCVAKVTKAQPSGTNSEDVIHLATAIMNKLEISSFTEDCGPTFKFMSCWQQLKAHPKFDLFLNPPDEDNRDDEHKDVDEEKDKEEYKRPIGRKRAKAMNAKRELDAKRINIAEATLLAQKERNELLKSQQEMALFTSQADTSNPVVAEYMSIMRKRVLDRLKTSETTQTSHDTPSSASVANTDSQRNSSSES